MELHIFLSDDLIKKLTQKMEELMATVKDIQDKVTALTASVAKETDLDQSIITLVQGLSATIADLKAQLVAAGTDPVALQAVVDGLTTAQTTIDANAKKIADAVVANTPNA